MSSYIKKLSIPVRLPCVISICFPPTIIQCSGCVLWWGYLPNKRKILSMEDADQRCHRTRCEATGVRFLLLYKVKNNNWDVSIHSVECRMLFAVFLLNRLDQFLFWNRKKRKEGDLWQSICSWLIFIWSLSLSKLHRIAFTIVLALAFQKKTNCTDGVREMNWVNNVLCTCIIAGVWKYFWKVCSLTSWLQGKEFDGESGPDWHMQC